MFTSILDFCHSRELTMQMPPISAYNIVEGSGVHLVLRRNQPVESQVCDFNVLMLGFNFFNKCFHYLFIFLFDLTNSR